MNSKPLSPSYPTRKPGPASPNTFVRVARVLQKGCDRNSTWDSLSWHLAITKLVEAAIARGVLALVVCRRARGGLAEEQCRPHQCVKCGLTRITIRPGRFLVQRLYQGVNPASFMNEYSFRKHIIVQ